MKNILRSALIGIILGIAILFFLIYDGFDHIKYGLSKEEYVYTTSSINSDPYIGNMKNILKYKECVSKTMDGVYEIAHDLKSGNLTDLEKALIINDRLVLKVQYAQEIENMRLEDAPPTYFSGYGALVDELAVCQGYALSYDFIMKYLGIESKYYDSEKMDHAWNSVKIDGIHYFVDVTHNDPMGVRLGTVLHDHFLLSSKAYYNSDPNHKVDDFDMSLTDTKYDKYFWRNIDSAFLYTAGNIFYIDNRKKTLNSFRNGKITKLMDIDDIWMSKGGSHWEGSFSYLNEDEGKLYYNDSAHIYQLDPLTRKTKKVWSPQIDRANHENIFGFLIQKGEFIIEYDSDANSQNMKRMSIHREDLEKAQ